MKWRFRFGAVAGNTLEFYDVAVFAAISSYLSLELKMQGYEQATEMVWGIFALRFIVRPLGGYIIGRYADKNGKKAALILTSFITGMTTLSMALLPIQLLGVYTPFVILFLQMALSFSYAGEYPSLAVYLFKDAQPNEISRISALIVGSGLTGVILSLGIVYLLENILSEDVMRSIGWRIPLLLGVVNVLISFWFRSRLPYQPIDVGKDISVNWVSVLHIFLISIPGSIVFFAQNLSHSLVGNYLELGEFKSIYALMSSSILLVLVAIISCYVDKHNYSEKIYKTGVISIIILSIPLYLLMSSGQVFCVFFAQGMIAIFSAMVLCNWASVMARPAKGQSTTLGVGYNLTSTLVGGVTPLIIGYLSQYHLAYVGAFIAVCGLSYFISYLLPKHAHT